MLRPLTDLPDGVIGFEASGEIRADDYRDTLLPAIDQELAAGRKVRCVLVFEQWEGMSGGAMWEDLKVGMSHFTSWQRIALVTDVEWMTNVVRLFGWMTPGELKQFSLAERDAAIAWAAAEA